MLKAHASIETKKFQGTILATEVRHLLSAAVNDHAGWYLFHQVQFVFLFRLSLLDKHVVIMYVLKSPLKAYDLLDELKPIMERRTIIVILNKR